MRVRDEIALKWAMTFNWHLYQRWYDRKRDEYRFYQSTPVDKTGIVYVDLHALPPEGLKSNRIKPDRYETMQEVWKNTR